MNDNLKYLFTGSILLLWFRSMYKIYDHVIMDSHHMHITIAIVTLLILYLMHGDLKVIGDYSQPVHQNNKNNIIRIKSAKAY